jgi:hypothetical protein
MSQSVYVVVRKHNQYPTVHSTLIVQTGLQWNTGGSGAVEGVYSYYPSQYAQRHDFVIHGPFQIQGLSVQPQRPSFPYNSFYSPVTPPPPNYLSDPSNIFEPRDF